MAQSAGRAKPVTYFFVKGLSSSFDDLMIADARQMFTV
jgi:hypothetical protein